MMGGMKADKPYNGLRAALFAGVGAGIAGFVNVEFLHGRDFGTVYYWAGILFVGVCAGLGGAIAIKTDPQRRSQN